MVPDERVDREPAGPESGGCEVKALSIRQPWAHLILCGMKTIENRTWRTDYRGPLAIHAGTKSAADWSHAVKDVALRAQGRMSIPLLFEAAAGVSPAFRDVTTTKRGCVLGIVDLVDIVTESDSPWFEGPYGWVLRNPRALPVPFVMPGRLGLFEVSESGAA